MCTFVFTLPFIYINKRGYRLWPAISVAAFLVNFANGASPLVALCISIGNTFEALVVAYLLNRLGFDNAHIFKMSLSVRKTIKLPLVYSDFNHTGIPL